MRPWARCAAVATAFALVASSGISGGCNAAFGVDELCFDCGVNGGSPTSLSTSSRGGQGGTGQGGGGHGGAGQGGCREGASRSCYDGPADTENVGLCRSGEQYCSAQGSWGECQAQVLPAQESCGDADDRDCNGYDCGQTVWARTYGDGADQESWRLGVVPGAAVVVAGTYLGTIDFGGGPLPAAAGRAGFVGLLSGDAEHLASWPLVANGGFQLEGLAVHPAGDVVVGGDLDGSIIVAQQQIVSSGGVDGLVVRTDGVGSAAWAARFGGNANDNVQALAWLASGDLLVAGYLGGAGGDFMGTSLTNYGATDVVLARLAAATGAVVWAGSFGSSGNQHPFGAEARPGDGAVVVGAFENHLDFGVGTLQSGGNNDAFVVAIDDFGQEIWSQAFGAAGDQQALAVAVGAGGESVVVGMMDRAFDVGTTVLPNAGGQDGFVLKLDPAGQPIWARAVGGTGDDRASGVAIDDGGAVWIVGNFEQSIDLGGGPLTGPVGASHTFVAKLAPDGSHLHSRALRTTGMGPAPFNYWSDWRQIVLDGTGFAYVTGYFRSEIDMGLGPVASAGGTDVFLAKLAP